MDAFKSIADVFFIDEFLVLCTGLPQDFGNRDFKPPVDVPCVVEKLCNKHQGLYTFLSLFCYQILESKDLVFVSVEPQMGDESGKPNFS